jgi:methylmalonyl-CoA carboxyltransferase large subunit
MNPEVADWSRITEALKALHQELHRLSERVAALESRAGSVPGTRSMVQEPLPEVPSPNSPSAHGEPLTEELLLVISAAVAAYLGKKPHIQQIRLIGETTWAQQGRVAIQASHSLATQHSGSEH